MKIFLSTFFTLLTVVNSMVHREIKETGTEHNNGVIQCPYTEGYENYPKYFCKGIYKYCTNYIIKSNGKDLWTYEGRFSLNDITERKLFVVTIANLSMDDTGPYGCGIEITGQDPFTVVSLTVIKANKPPNPPKTHQSTSTTARISTNTQDCTNSSKENSEATVTNRTGSETGDTGNPTRPSSDIFISVGGAFGGVLLMLAVISGIFYVFRCKPGKNETDHVNSEVDNEDVRLYEEIQHTTPTQDNTSIPTNQCFPSQTGNNAAAGASEEYPNPRPACMTIYSSITNPTPELHPEYTLATNPKPITDNASQSDHSSNEPNYSKIYFINDNALDSSVGCNDTTYSTVQNVLQG